MGLEMGLWRADGDKLTRLEPSALALESLLESYIESDPLMMGEPLLIIGRQVRTEFGGFIDLLALDDSATVHVIELKRDKTPRDVVAQAIDYGSWVATLGRQDIEEIFEAGNPGVQLEEAFAERFDMVLPEEVNAAQKFTIVASRVDNSTARIVRFLNEDYGVPINVVFFRHFNDNGASYLARTWLVEHEGQPGTGVGMARKAKTREEWNGTDWYVAFGEYKGGRQREDGRKYGFVSGGGGKWYSNTLKKLTVGARIFVHIPQAGYVGVGEVIGEARRFDELAVEVDGQVVALKDQPLVGNYRHGNNLDDEVAEWAVPVEWLHAVPREQAFWKKGMYANQNTTTKLTQKFTIEQVTEAFGLAD